MLHKKEFRSSFIIYFVATSLSDILNYWLVCYTPDYEARKTPNRARKF